MVIDEWEFRLTRHFSELKKLRISTDHHLFGLEHGLSEEESKELKILACNSLRESKNITKYPLTWVVSASEVGYLFSGGEFWQTFQEKTPGWEEYGKRNWIRFCFQHFRDNYYGAEPSGTWASQRTIISWPITHAILALDLQRQLAKALYKVRHHLDETHIESPAELGRLVASYSWDSTSRFKEILQEEVLIGQIAAALLQVDSSDDGNFILRSTLLRIKKDLDRESNARRWLREAQHQAKKKAQLRGLQGSNKNAKNTQSREKSHLGRLLLKPHLQLYKKDQNSWKIYAEFPDYSALLKWLPACKEPLTSSRIFVEGSSGKPIAPRWLLYGIRSKQLIKWPSESKSLLRFENSNQVLDDLLQMECVLSEGPWVFKLKTSGIASQIMTKTVRHNEDYIFVSSEHKMPKIPNIQEIKVDCEGVIAAYLSIGAELSEELQKALSSYGIQVVRELQLTPVSAIPTQWDGEGAIEWLSIDVPIISIESNYPIEQLEFELEFGEENIDNLIVNNSSKDNSILLELPMLNPGLYCLHVKATSINGESEVGHLDISIRNPTEFIDSHNVRGAFLLNVYPPGPTMEEVWEGEVSLEVIGPKSRKITCTLCFYESGSPKPRFKEKIPLRLPITKSKWAKQFSQHWYTNESCAFAYGEASNCEILFEGDELGCQRLECERAFSPLRWAYQHVNNKYEIRLIDDSEESGEKTVNFYSFDEPVINHKINSRNLRKSPITANAGLYVASVNGQNASIVIPPEIESFDQFLPSPKIKNCSPSVEIICQHLLLLEYWANARLVNVLIGGRFRNFIIEALIQDIFRMLGGDRWIHAECDLINRSGNNWTKGMITAVPSRKFGIGWAEAILGHLPSLSNMSPNERVEFLATLTNERERLCEVALRLASAPWTLLRHFNNYQLEKYLLDLRHKTTISRIARFFCLEVVDFLEGHSKAGLKPYTGWQWN